LKKVWNGGFCFQTDAASDHTPLALEIPRYSGPSLNETYCGRWLAACCRAHPPVCRCCNPCPKSRGPIEQSARPRIRAFHFPFACSPSPAAPGKTGFGLAKFGLWKLPPVVFIQGLLSGVAAPGLHQLVMAAQFGPVKVDLVASFEAFKRCQWRVCEVSTGSPWQFLQPLGVAGENLKFGHLCLPSQETRQRLMKDNSDSLQNAGMSLRSGAGAFLQPGKRMRCSRSAWLSDTRSRRSRCRFETALGARCTRSTFAHQRSDGKK
jgi:hypothetical protein